MASDDIHTEREHFLERLIELEVARLDEKIAGEKELRRARREDDQMAVAKAEAAMNKRLDGMNQIREQLREQAAGFLPRETYETALVEWQAWRHAVDEILSADRGRDAGVTATGRLLATIMTIGIAVIVAAVAIANYLSSH